MKLVFAIGAATIGACIAAGAVSFMKYVGEDPNPSFKGFCKKICEKVAKCDKCEECDRCEGYMVADTDGIED